MYLRRCYRKKDGKRHAYWALVESYRTARGPRQRVVAWLGAMDEQGRLGVKRCAERAASGSSVVFGVVDKRVHAVVGHVAVGIVGVGRSDEALRCHSNRDGGLRASSFSARTTGASRKRPVCPRFRALALSMFLGAPNWPWYPFFAHVTSRTPTRRQRKWRANRCGCPPNRRLAPPVDRCQTTISRSRPAPQWESQDCPLGQKNPPVANPCPS